MYEDKEMIHEVAVMIAVGLASNMGSGTPREIAERAYAIADALALEATKRKDAEAPAEPVNK